MVHDLDIPVEICGVPTVRESDGLAMSSRNVLLDAKERHAATILSRALFDAEEICLTTSISAQELGEIIRSQIEAEPLAQIRSIDITDAVTLATLQGALTSAAVALLAVSFGDVLLIDQRTLIPNQTNASD